MVSVSIVRATKLGAAAVCALALSFAPVFAQGKNDKKTPAAPQQQQQQGAEVKPGQEVWYKLCMDVPVPETPKPGEDPAKAKQQKPEDMKKVNVCVTQADVRESSLGLLVGKVAIRQVQGQDKPVVFVMLPLSPNFQPLFPPGALVKVDDKEALKLVYTTCDAAGCYAEATVEPNTIAEFKTGKQVAYLGMDVAGRALSIPVPLEGFAKALDGAPVPMEKFNEEQKKISEVIRQRIVAMRKQQEEAAKNGQAGADASKQPAPKK